MSSATDAAFFVSADWSKNARKRSVHVADVHRCCIRHENEASWSLTTLLSLARRLAHRGPVLVGIDLVLGVPKKYWTELRAMGRWKVTSFIDWLGQIDPAGDFFETVEDPATWCLDRPFFTVAKGDGGRTSFEKRLPDGFHRRIDRCTGANPVFAVSGIPGTVGSATRAVWQELAPLVGDDRDFAVWPFDGELHDLLSRKTVVLAETYPRLAYAAALTRDLPTGRIDIGKTKRDNRVHACDLLERADWVRDGGVDLGDLSPARDDEDAFDSHLTAAAVLRCIRENQPLTDPDWIDKEAEGSMLLAGPVDPSRRGRSLRVPPSRRAEMPPRPKTLTPSPSNRRDAPDCSAVYLCPIPKCDRVFHGSRAGWDAHVASRAKHPDWHANIADGTDRKRLFKQQYRDWFVRRSTDSLHRNRR